MLVLNVPTKLVINNMTFPLIDDTVIHARLSYKKMRFSTTEVTPNLRGRISPGIIDKLVERRSQSLSGPCVREVFAWGEATMFLRVFSNLLSSLSRSWHPIRSIFIRTTACEHRPPWGAPGWRTDQPVCLAPPLVQSSCCASSPFLPFLLLLFCEAPDFVFRHGRRRLAFSDAKVVGNFKNFNESVRLPELYFHLPKFYKSQFS